MPGIYNHYRATADTYPPGVYRVVGTGDPVALLRVTDADGRRQHTGHLLRVSEQELTDHFEQASDPDRGFDPVRGLTNAVQGLYWQIRKFF